MKKEQDELKYVDIDEAAKQFGVSAGTVRNWMNSGQLLKAVKIKKN